MAMGRQGARQGEMLVTFDELPKSPGHVFYGRLQAVLADAGFDACVETLCQPDYAAVMGAPSLPPGRYFRMHLVGYFEGIDSERGLEWRCADSLSLRDFLGLGLRDRVPDHSWLSRSRARLPLEVHEQVFAWVLARLAERGLVKGHRIGVDASTMEANAAMRSIRRRDSGEGYRDMLTRMAAASGTATPSAAELKQFDRERKGKRLSNLDWAARAAPGRPPRSDLGARRATRRPGSRASRTAARGSPTSPSMRSTSTPQRSSRPRSSPPTVATPPRSRPRWRRPPGVSRRPAARRRASTPPS